MGSLPGEPGGLAVVISPSEDNGGGAFMILSAMIFAAVTAIVGFFIGFLLGQARSRMSYEEELKKVEEARASLERDLARLGNVAQLKSPTEGRAPGAGPAGRCATVASAAGVSDPTS